MSPARSVRVFAGLDSFYAEWRVRCGVVALLREHDDSPPERLLQAIWQHQRVLRDQLKTADDLPVRVLHPGFRSFEGGPDFRGAVIQLGDSPVCVGDIEVDLRASGWRAHGHDRNPSFQNVVLHVIWENEQAVTGAPPLLHLRPALDAPLGELSLWLGGESPQLLPQELRGKCCAPLRGLQRAELIDLLEEAAEVRLRSKAAQFQARARQAGWEQSLWEGLFRALGYKNNVWPMQRLAELRASWFIPPMDALTMQARLLGLSSLLPPDLTRTRPGTDDYLRQVWDLWWRERGEFSDLILPRVVWHLHGLRPANHPQRRLALAAGWSLIDELPAKLEKWCVGDSRDTELRDSLLETLQVRSNDFWSNHWTLRSASLKRPQPLLGATRMTELAMNTILPWLWARALEGRSEALRGRLEQLYFKWPPAQDNAVLRLARQRLLGTTDPRILPGAAAQQGLIQIVRDFCDHSNAICEACKLPELVQQYLSSGSKRELHLPKRNS